MILVMQTLTALITMALIHALVTMATKATTQAAQVNSISFSQNRDYLGSKENVVYW